MPDHQGKIETRCPSCHAKYRVPAASAGHHARCVKCQTKFRVPEVAQTQAPADWPHPPTEDDILKWLNEGSDDEFLAPRPRVISDREPAEPRTPSAETVSASVTPPSGVNASDHGGVLDSATLDVGQSLRRTG
jgi:predicted Zn finger-like uncharacterized protein